VNVYVLAAGTVLPEFVRRPLAARGHDVHPFHDTDSFLSACRAESARRRRGAARIGGEDGHDIVHRLPPRRGRWRRHRSRACSSRRRRRSRRRAPRWRRVLARALFRQRSARRRRRGDARAQAHPRRRRLGAHPSPHRAHPRGGRLRTSSAPSTAPRRSISVDERKPDLVITDVEMPKSDGYVVCKTIKERCAKGQLTADAGDHLLGARRSGRSGEGLRRRRRRLSRQAAAPTISRRASARCSLRSVSIPGSAERILVVDDSPAIRHLIRRRAQPPGLRRHRRRRRPGRARGRRAKIRFDMIVTDYDMPRMNGFELVHALKRDPKCANIPTLIVTAARHAPRSSADARRRPHVVPGQAVLRRQMRRHRRARARRAPASSPTRKPRVSTSATAPCAPPRTPRARASSIATAVRAEARRDGRLVQRHLRLSPR